MAETLNESLPTMVDLKTLERRSELMNAEGTHLTYTKPRPEARLDRRSPVKFFPGLCIAFLMYTRERNGRFCAGAGGGGYSVGFIPNHSKYGLFSLTTDDNDVFSGYNRKDFGGFHNSQYHYIYIYFKTDDIMNGCIDDLDLADDTRKRALSKSQKKITLGYSAAFHNAYTLEVHFVVWNGVFNKHGAPSRSLMDTLWEKTMGRKYVLDMFEDFYELRTGTLLTVSGNYRRASHPAIGVEELGGHVRNIRSKVVSGGAVFVGFTDPQELYLIQITIADLTGYCRVHNQTYDIGIRGGGSNTTGTAYCIVWNIKPKWVHVETMGQTWK